MKKVIKGHLALLCGCVLSACTPASPMFDNSVEFSESQPTNYSLYEMGIVMSEGSVDLYDPMLATFVIPQVAQPSTDPLRNFPQNKTLIVREKNVNVYSLDTGNDVEEEFTKVIEGIGDPVPLTDDEFFVEN